MIIQKNHKLQQLIFPKHILTKIINYFKKIPTNIKNKNKKLLYNYLTLSNYQTKKNRQKSFIKFQHTFNHITNLHNLI